MATTRFEAKVRERPGVAVVDLYGEINALAEEELNAAYTEVARLEAKIVLLNFAAVDYINSTGIALIVGVLARARKDHIDVTACGLVDHYQQIFEITRLADFMTIFPDEASAVADRPTSTFMNERGR
jgi:anti-anti-sigma factor